MQEDFVAIGLGSNLGDRRAAIDGAIEGLDADDEITVVAHSAVIETEPVGPPGQGRYLNAALLARTSLTTREILERCLGIEARFGRTRRREKRWGPRILDLDILLHGDRVIDEKDLVVPHPRLAERRFVLVPLAEIAGWMVHPILGLSVQSLLERHRPRSEVSADFVNRLLR